MNTEVDKADFWESRYIQQKTPWDIGQVAPAFKKYLLGHRTWDHGQLAINKEQLNRSQVHCPRSIVLGCGLGYDAFFFAKQGFEVYAFDFSESAIKKANETKAKMDMQNIYFYKEDLFELKNKKRWMNSFDYVLEHTCFCAINPKRRNEYVDLIKYLLKPGGKLIGLFFVRSKPGGPPYGTNEKELRELFKDFKEIEKLHIEECLHGDVLQGDEYFGVFEKVL